jgi:uncharacterized protein involved in exopolysaccharide biosynthesis
LPFGFLTAGQERRVAVSDEMGPKDPAAGEVNLLEYWLALYNRRRLVLCIVSGCMLAAVLYSLLVPRIYRSTATVIVPQESGTRGLLSGLALSGIVQSIPGISVPSLTPNRDLFVSILQSRTMQERVVERFNIRERYGLEYLEDARKKLREVTWISAEKEGLISVTVGDSDQQRAAEMSNYYVEELGRMLSSFETTEASKQKAFIEGRLAETEKALRNAEEGLKVFKETHGAISLEEQAKTTAELAGELKSKILAAQVQLEVALGSSAEESVEVAALRKSIDEMKRQLAEVQYGEGLKLGPQEEIHVPFAEFPKVGLEVARLTREAKVQETVCLLLTQQYEEAKMAEARDMPTVQVLDAAIPAERKTGPSTVLNLVLSGFASLFFSVLLVFFLEHVDRLKKEAALRTAKSLRESSTPPVPVDDREVQPLP